jgi:hypothetical protein
MKNATSSLSVTDSDSAFFSRIATRISSSGGSIATVSPQPEARDQPFLHPDDFLRVRVAADDDLAVRLDERVESVEELLLGAVLVGEELDIVDQQQVERMVVALELVERLLLIGTHHVGNVLLGVRIAHSRLLALRGDMVSDRLQQVRLPKADAAVDEQRVVGDAGILGNLDRRGACELVGLAGHETVEREVAIEARPLELGRTLGLAAHRRRRARRLPGCRRQHELDLQFASGGFRGEASDARREAFPHQVENEPIRRAKHERAGFGAGGVG